MAIEIYDEDPGAATTAQQQTDGAAQGFSEQPADPSAEPDIDIANAQLEEPVLSEAQCAALIDSAGNVLYEKGGERQMPPASITKVMTAMVTLDGGHDLDEIVTTVAPDLGADSQMADFGEGDRVTLEELLRVMLVYSANDAAYNAAVFTAGSEEAFVELMNKKAAEIGMTHTHFANPHGLENDDHYTCATDLAIMGRYALEHYPFIARTVLEHNASTTVHGTDIVLDSTDKLLDTFAGIRGIKTGAIANHYTFLGASGRGDVQLYVAVLGCQTFMGRFNDAAAIMEWGYAHYDRQNLSHSDWVVRVQPHAFDLGMSTALSADGAYDAPHWKYASDGLHYQSVLCRPGRLLDTGTPYGWFDWSQANDGLGKVVYATREVPQRTSAWPLFMRPLFEDLSVMGRTDDA